MGFIKDAFRGSMKGGAIGMLTGIPGGGLTGGIIGGIQAARKAKATSETGEVTAEPEDPFTPPAYEIPEETQQILESSQKSADLIRGQAEEMVDVADVQRGMLEAPGAGEARRAMEETTAASVAGAAQAGGASASSMGAISQIQAGNISEMRDLAIQTQMFQEQADKEYRQALLDKGGAEMAATQMEVQGLAEMARAKETQYQVNVLDPFYAKQQYDLMMAANEAAKKPTFGEQAKKALPWNWGKK